MTYYITIGGKTLFSRCKKCDVWIPKGKMREHLKKECDGEQGKLDRQRISRNAMTAVNKVFIKIAHENKEGE